MRGPSRYGLRARQRRHRFRHVTESRFGLTVFVLAGFDLHTLLQNRGGVLGQRLAGEDKGMASNEFLGELCDHVFCREAAGFAGDLRVKNHLEQHVAQFFF